MICAIVTVRAKPGKGPELEADFRAWAEVVKAKEPGTLLYSLNRSREEADTYVAVEIYADEAARQAHVANFQARAGGAGDVFAGPPEIRLLDRLA